MKDKERVWMEDKREGKIDKKIIDLKKWIFNNQNIFFNEMFIDIYFRNTVMSGKRFSNL